MSKIFEKAVEEMVDWLVDNFSLNYTDYWFENQLKRNFFHLLHIEGALEEAMWHLPEIREEYKSLRRKQEEAYHDEYGDHLYYIPPSEY